MKRTLLFINAYLLAITAIAQNKPADAKVQHEQPYGIIDTADLAMKQCDFEKDANAEVLFNIGDEIFDEYYDIVFIVHKRIKIFNENGKDQANIKIPFVNRITDIKAETINLNGKTITYTPVDVNLFYKQKVSSDVKELTFTFPDVRPGSVIELQYKWKIHSAVLPAWYFQEDIPTRYSEIGISFLAREILNIEVKARGPLSTDTSFYINGRNSGAGRKHIRAMTNVPSLKTEPFMTPEFGVRQKCILKYHADFWGNVYAQLKIDPDFGLQLDNKLPGEADTLAKLNAITNKYVKADSIFNLVQRKMDWNKDNAWYTNIGIKKAWAQKKGNSTEINLILCRLLNQANIEAHPMLVSTPDYGSVDPEYASTSQFNKTVVYLPVDSAHFYILDASDKHNVYNVIPYDLLSTYAFEIDPATKKYGYTLFRIGALNPSRQLVYIKADITPNGKISGEANIVSDTYNRSASLELYKTLGEKKYIDYLSDNDNSLKISSLKLDSTEQDSLPLMQRMHIDLDLTASDENYIYFNPNLLTSFSKNPFLSKDRLSDIDFTFENTYIVSGDYGIPAGYKVDVLPENRTITMEDKSMTFKRIIGEQDGRVMVHYVITRKRSYYKQDEYTGLYNFYKEMFRMLDEQIVFKKS
jgi:hypothetical protein